MFTKPDNFYTHREKTTIFFWFSLTANKQNENFLSNKGLQEDCGSNFQFSTLSISKQKHTLAANDNVLDSQQKCRKLRLYVFVFVSLSHENTLNRDDCLVYSHNIELHVSFLTIDIARKLKCSGRCNVLSLLRPTPFTYTLSFRLSISFSSIEFGVFKYWWGHLIHMLRVCPLWRYPLMKSIQFYLQMDSVDMHGSLFLFCNTFSLSFYIWSNHFIWAMVELRHTIFLVFDRIPHHNKQIE